MKFRYDKEDDVLMIWLSKEKIDHAEQKDNLIVHFSPLDKPVLLEILEASKFIKSATQTVAGPKKEKVFA